MIKHKYVPLDIGKKKYGVKSKEENKNLIV